MELVKDAAFFNHQLPKFALGDVVYTGITRSPMFQQRVIGIVHGAVNNSNQWQYILKHNRGAIHIANEDELNKSCEDLWNEAISRNKHLNLSSAE